MAVCQNAVALRRFDLTRLRGGLAVAARRLEETSHFLGRYRWAFVPLGLLSLIVCGVHAAADTLDDRILRLVDLLDEALDTAISALPFARNLGDIISFEHRVWVARSLALVWELLADLVLALPTLGYREKHAPVRPFVEQAVALRALARRMVRRPTVLRLVRPLATAAVALAGACAVASALQSSAFGALHGMLGFGLAASLAKLVAAAALLGVLLCLGGRAVLRNAEHADLLSERARLKPWDLPFLRGLWASALVAPLALAALVDACPILSFFR